MKIRDFYSDWRLLAGVVLVVTGAVNWTIGFAGTKVYGQSASVTRQTSSDDLIRAFDDLDENADHAVLEPLTAVEREATLNSAHMDFYHAIFFVGQAFIAAGLVLMAVGLFAVIRRDSRQAVNPALDR